MTSSHDAYAGLTTVCQKIGADTAVPTALRGRILALYTAMNGSSISLGVGDMGLIMQGLAYLATDGIKTTHV